MKRVFIIHGWGGFPEEAWFPWLKKQLEQKGVEVYTLKMPETDYPKINKWVDFLAQAVGQPDENTYLVGHSIGTQTIFRYLEKINTKIGGVLSVAGFYTLIPDSLEGSEEEEIVKPWLETAIDNDKVKQNAGKITAIFADNDQYVGLDNVDLFKNRVDAKIVILKGKGHMGASEGFTEIPEILEEMEEIMEIK